jgi:tRNA(Ile)-lysidine synthase
VAARLQGLIGPSDRLVVALSGGVDSVVLLDCLRSAARSLRFRLSALHINHQLSPNAGRWAVFCRRLCRGQRVPFRAESVTVPRGGGPEAAARAARYGIFAREDCDYIVLAHHRDDQVETFLLQLFRGAGVKGLAAMPFLRAEGGGLRAEGKNRNAGGPGSSSRLPHPSSPKILRPLLDVTRAEILDYARRRKLDWIEDESNADPYFPRNYLRRDVLPAIARRFASYRDAVARSARHIAEAAEVLDEVAAADGERFLKGGTLAVAALRRLSAARARNLLRYFIAGHGLAMPATVRIDEALRQILSAKEDARVAIGLDGAVLRRFDGRLHLVKHAPRRAMAPRPWRGEKRIALPELGGTLVMERVPGSGISLARLRGKPVTIRPRRGGERLQPDCDRPRRSLKNLLQEKRMPPWQRDRLPLIFQGDALVWVPGIGIDCAYQAGSGDPALMPAWVPAA